MEIKKEQIFELFDTFKQLQFEVFFVLSRNNCQSGLLAFLAMTQSVDKKILNL